MAQLSQDWFVSGLQDFEHKKYLLLAYLQHIRQQFDQTELYPAFAELIHHYRNLQEFQENENAMFAKMKRDLSEIDWEKLALKYEDPEERPELEMVREVVGYALPLVRKHLRDGKDIYEFIASHILIEQVGVLPMQTGEGYFLLTGGMDQPIRAYCYRITVFHRAEEPFRSLQTELVGEFSWSLGRTLEGIKHRLIRERPDLPNPATFAIASQMGFPREASLVPVAKRLFMRHLATLAA